MKFNILRGRGFFGTGYTSTHTMVNIQKTNYTLRWLALPLFPSSTTEQVLYAAPFLGMQFLQVFKRFTSISNLLNISALKSEG